MPRGTTLFRVIDAHSLRTLLRPPVLTVSSRLRLRAQRRVQQAAPRRVPVRLLSAFHHPAALSAFPERYYSSSRHLSLWTLLYYKMYALARII